MVKGIVYIIQPAELIGTKVYKIGMSNEKSLSRCASGYKVGTRYRKVLNLSPLKLSTFR
jgi:hypothetical protein